MSRLRSSSLERPERPERFEPALERRKLDSTVQLLFKCSRLLQEEALERVRRSAGLPGLRPSHTALFPHIDLTGTRLTDLADRLGITKQAVGQLVEDLERMGMVERTPDPADGRARLVRFSARGGRGLLHGLTLLRRLERELAAEIGAARMQALNRTLQRLLPALTRRRR